MTNHKVQSSKFKAQCEKKILILDGAMGTEIQKYNLTEEDFRGDRFRDVPGMMKGNNDMLNITRPDVISDIYRRYLEAGADIITANTFSCQRISQADYHLEDCAREMAFEGARLARIECDKFSTPDKPRFVAGDVGPTNKTCSMSPDVSDPAAREITYDELFTDVCEQVDGLIEGGADVILIETIFDTLNCKAMIDAAITMMKKHGVEVPIMISLTVSDLAGRTLSGQTVDAFLASLSPYPIFSVGMNCAFGAPQMKPFIEHLAKVAPYYISAHPNAGLPNEMGQYDETAESMAPQIAEFIDEGIVNIIGGCCGTSPEFIAHYARSAEGKKPHQVVEKPKYMWLSGLDLLQVDDSVHLPVDASRFVNVGERCNVAGSRKFLRLINEKGYEEAIGIARKQVADGAAVVDVNMDDGLLDAKAEMVNFLNMIAAEPEIAKVPVMIDSSKWDVILAGLKCCQGKCIVNSISLKEGEEVFLSHARDVMRYGAAVVVMCFDEVGQATTYERRIEIAELVKATGDVAAAVAGVSVWLFLGCRAVLALGEAGNFPAAIKVTAEYFPKKDRAFATSIFNSGSSVGALAAPLTIPLIAKYCGWEMAFIIIGALGFVWMGFWLWLYKKPAENPNVNAEELAYINQDDVQPLKTDEEVETILPRM